MNASTSGNALAYGNPYKYLPEVALTRARPSTNQKEAATCSCGHAIGLGERPPALVGPYLRPLFKSEIEPAVGPLDGWRRHPRKAGRASPARFLTR